jgi:hypothetical protein
MKKMLMSSGMFFVALGCAGPGSRLQGFHDAPPGGMAMATAPRYSNPRQASSTETVCENEVVAGSHIRRPVCYSVEMRKQDQQSATQSAFERLSPLPPTMQ